MRVFVKNLALCNSPYETLILHRNPLIFARVMEPFYNRFTVDFGRYSVVFGRLRSNLHFL